MDTSVVITTISVLVAIAASIYGIYSNKKKNTNMDVTEATENGRNIGTVLTELGYIKSSVDDIKTQQRTMDEKILGVVKDIVGLNEFKRTTEDRLTRLESDVRELNK